MVKLRIINSNRHTILSHLLNNTWILEEFLIFWLVFEPPLKSDRSHSGLKNQKHWAGVLNYWCHMYQ